MIDPETARRIKLVGFDVDGVLTDAGGGRGRVGSRPGELKRLDIQEGGGMGRRGGSGLKTAIVSGRMSQATTLRAEELEIDEVFQDDGAQKLSAFEEILARQGLSWEEAAFVGDDLPDLPLLTRVGLPVAVQNAVSEVREVARYVTQMPGGRGAVREFIEAFLRARGAWEAAVERYVNARGCVPGVMNAS